MTTDQLITSGLLEAYRLGVATKAEYEHVEQLLMQDPALLTHLNRLDADLEQHFSQQAVPPPPAIRDQLELRIARQELQKQARQNQAHFGYNAPVNEPAHQPNYVDVEVDNTHIRVHKNWRPAFIAVFILSKIFLITALYFYVKADSQTQEITRLRAEVNQSVRK